MIYVSIRRKHMARRNPGGKIPLDDAVVTLPADSYAYTGSQITPAPTVTLYGGQLTANTDYTVAYTGNVDVGQGVVTVTGTGGYEGVKRKSFAIVRGSGAWAGFDLSNLGVGSHAASAQLTDGSAVYQSSECLSPYTLQVLPDGRLHFGAQRQGHAYVWGFDDGHPFDVSHFKSSFDSRSGAVSFFGSSLLAPDGLSGVYSYYDSGNLTKFSLSTAYDLSTRGGGSTVTFASGAAIHMAFSADGSKFFYKPRGGVTNSNRLYCRALASPYTVAGDEEETYANLDDITGETNTWRAFCFSPDGRHMVATSGNGLGNVHKFALSTPWDITTMTRVSYATVLETPYHKPNAVAVNASGTKMLLFDRNDYDSARWKFYEYNLT